MSNFYAQHLDTGYLKRNLQARVDHLLTVFPAVLITGAHHLL